MALRLRAYLMYRDADGGWAIDVCETLEDVVRCWEKRPQHSDAAILHVGFERRVARTFDEISSKFPGKVLLTPGAKQTLPNAFQTSEEPIGFVDGESVYLALEGWGYSAVPPTKKIAAIDPTENEDWVVTYLVDHIDDSAALNAVGISSDFTYLEYEDKLDAELRLRLGAFRAEALIGGNFDDPCLIAGAAPPWLAKKNLDELNLTVRLANVFRNMGVVQVVDLSRYTLTELLGVPNFGQTSARHLVEILRHELATGPRDLQQAVERPNSPTLLAAVRQSLLNLAERERDIIHRRMGLDCPPETLAQIGESYGITRERIRQIEDKALSRLIQRELWDDILAEKLKRLLADREFPLPLMGVEAVDPWFEGVAQSREAIGYLLANIAGPQVALVDIDGIEYLAFINQDQWEATIGSARRLLASGANHGWTKAQCQRFVEGLLPENAHEFGSLLWEKTSNLCHFSGDGNEAILTSYGRGAEQIVEAVLIDSDVPLHYSEIAIRASQRSRKDIDERRAHSAAAEIGHLFGPGTYGLLKHLPASREYLDGLADEAADVILEGPTGRQWHAAELLEALVRRGTKIDEAITKHVLDIALKRQGALRSFGRMVWAAQEESSGQGRVEVRQAVVSILENAGQPLSTSELRQRLVALRGINHGMQIPLIDPIIKLGSSLWALNDRDISVKRSDQGAMLDRVVELLQIRGSPVHISECEEVFGLGIPPRALFCLASQNEALQVTTGSNLCLRNEIAGSSSPDNRQPSPDEARPLIRRFWQRK